MTKTNCFNTQQEHSESANSVKAADFKINLDLDVCRIAPKMYSIHSLVGVGHFATFAKYHKNRLVTVREMLINLLLYNGEKNGKVIRNLYPGAVNRQKIITSRGSPLAYAYHIWSTCVTV